MPHTYTLVVDRLVHWLSRQRPRRTWRHRGAYFAHCMLGWTYGVGHIDETNSTTAQIYNQVDGIFVVNLVAGERPVVHKSYPTSAEPLLVCGNPLLILNHFLNLARGNTCRNQFAPKGSK